MIGNSNDVPPRRCRRAGPLLFGSSRSMNTRVGSDNGERGYITNLKVIVITLFLIATSIVIPPVFGGSESAIAPHRSADYGIFDNIQDLHEEQSGRVDDPDVIRDVDSVMGSLATSEYVFTDPGSAGFNEETITLPEPITHSPVVFEALKKNPIINDTNVLDWILPPPLSEQGALNYLVLVKSGDREIWALGSMIPRIGITVDSSLDKWVYIDVDGDPSTGDIDGNDIRTRMTFAKNLLARDWEVSLLPPTLKFHNAGVRIEIESLSTSEGNSQVGGSVYFIKGISYGGITGEGKNYIWSVGFELDRFMDTMKVLVQAREWKSDPLRGSITTLLSGGSLDFRNLRILDVLGPYTLSYEFGTPPPEVGISISVMRIFNKELRDRAFIRLDLEKDTFHERIVKEGSLALNIKDFGSPIDRLEWNAGGDKPSEDDTISLRIHYSEFGEDLVDSDIIIPILPNRLTINLEYSEENGRNMTTVDLITPSGLGKLWFREVIYPGQGIPGWENNWNATVVELKNIPRRLRVETTAAVPQPAEVSGNLNIFDNFMSQIAGRFYRIGNVLREIPRAVAEIPGRKGSTVLDCYGDSIGSLDYRFTSGPFLNASGNWIAFYDHGTHNPAISAHLEGIRIYRGSFREGSDITLGLNNVSKLKIAALYENKSAIVDISNIPSLIHLNTSKERISYEGMENGIPARIGAVEYRYRDPGLKFDVNIYDIPSSLTLLRSDEQVDVRSGNGIIGSIEMFTTNSAGIPPLNLRERNFVSVHRDAGRSAVGFRMNRFKAFRYNNGSRGFIDLDTSGEANLYALIDDSDSKLQLRAAFVPLPAHTHIDTPSVIDVPEMNIPNILGIKDISEYSDILLSLSEIGRAPIVLAAGLSEGLTRSIGKYSTGFSMSWSLSEKGGTLDLILTVRKTGDFIIQPAHWTHGIWIEQMGSGENSSLNGNIYLNGMPETGSVNLSFSQETTSATINFKGYSPDFSWILIRTSGVQDRDITVYLTGLEKGMDLALDLRITTDLSIGGAMVIDMSVEVFGSNGEKMDLGPMLATLRKASPILSIRQMYMPEIPSRLDLSAEIGDGVSATYDASRSIEYLYFKITKFLDGRWSQVYAIFHDLPHSFTVQIEPTRDFTIQEPFPLQGLPLIMITTSDDKMDMFIEYDGAGFGQRGRYKIYADNVENTSTSYSGNDYIIDSDGIGFLSLEMGRLPVMESFTVSSLSILGSHIEHLRLSVQMGFGTYPVIQLTEARGGSFQIKLSGELSLNEHTYRPHLYFVTLRTRTILGLEMITGVSTDRDTIVMDLGSNDGGVTMPAPLLTLWSWILGGAH